MTHTQIITLLLTIVFSGHANAELSVQLTQMNLAAATDTHRVAGWEGIKISYKPDDDNLYGFLSYEEANVCPKGCAFRYKFIGLGVGNKIKLTNKINLFGDIGYYFIKNDWGIRKREFNENLYYYMNARWLNSNGDGYYWFDEYEVKNSDALAGTIGVEMIYPITNNTTTAFVFSYRQMKIKEEVSGYRDVWDFDHTGQKWETIEKKNYSSTNFGISFNYKF